MQSLINSPKSSPLTNRIIYGTIHTVEIDVYNLKIIEVGGRTLLGIMNDINGDQITMWNENPDYRKTYSTVKPIEKTIENEPKPGFVEKLKTFVFGKEPKTIETPTKNENETHFESGNIYDATGHAVAKYRPIKMFDLYGTENETFMPHELIRTDTTPYKYYFDRVLFQAPHEKDKFAYEIDGRMQNHINDKDLIDLEKRVEIVGAFRHVNRIEKQREWEKKYRGAEI